jgi:hypothetical protein
MSKVGIVPASSFGHMMSVDPRRADAQGSIFRASLGCLGLDQAIQLADGTIQPLAH